MYIKCYMLSCYMFKVIMLYVIALATIPPPYWDGFELTKNIKNI